MLQDSRPAAWADLPGDLLVSVFNSLRHPRDLLACACACKAWRNGELRAFQPMLDYVQDYGGLDRLMRLTPIQLAALRDVSMSLYDKDSQSATVSAMILTFISRSLPRLQRLVLDYVEPFEADDDWSQVGCSADAWYNLQTLREHARCCSQMIWQPRDIRIFCAMLPKSL